MQLWLCFWSWFFENFSGGGGMNKVYGKTNLSKMDFPFKSFDKKLVFLQRMSNFFPCRAQGKKKFIPNLWNQLLWNLLHMFSLGLSCVRTSMSASAGRPDASDNPTDVRHSTRRTAWQTAASSTGCQLRPSVEWRTAAPPRPSARGRPPGAILQGPSAQPKLWSPITIDLEVRFMRVIPF
jgi:hypothetical protein